MKTKSKNKQGISLIVLVITIIIRYDKLLKASKIDKVLPKNKIEVNNVFGQKQLI